MNWIKENRFLSALLGITLGLVALLTFVGIKGGSKFEEARVSFEDAYTAVQKSEKLPLYPTKDNVTAKKKALDDYRKSIEVLREDYMKFTVDPAAPAITTQQFTERLKAAVKEVEQAFVAADSKLPDGFFMAFESYRGELAKTGAIPMLDYQLQAVKHLLLGLAEARPSELIRIYREKIPEESDKPYVPGENEVAREFSYEIAVRGSEESVRKFVSKLGEKKSFFYVVRSIRINNERDTPPKVSDAKFEKPPAPAVDPAAVFGPAFFGEPQPATPDPAAPVADDAAAGEGAEADAAPAAPAAPVVDTSKKLGQVLGDEELLVFVRFDILLFSPAKELVKP